MVKLRSSYVCQQCGYSQTGWSGRCPECESWGSLVETIVRENNKQSLAGYAGKKSEVGSMKKTISPISLSSIPLKSTTRISTKISELDRVLGGGIVPGQVILIAGEPGIGKSTLLLQLSNELGSALYVSGEESPAQLKIRADRLGVKDKNLKILEETDIDSVINTISNLQGPTLQAAVVDSIQTMSTSDLSGMAGSVGQVRECAYRLVRLAKEKNVPVFIVGHITKEGTVAGPSVLMHIVDTVLWFEGDKSLIYRMIRAVKNRFGPTDEVGIFNMEDKGLVSVTNPENLFLSGTDQLLAGISTSVILQGTRPLLVEVQSLVVPSKMTFPKRVSQGFDSRRFELMLAILQRRQGIPFYEYDAYLNIAGGISIKNDPSVDLAVCLSLSSAYFDKSLPIKSVAIGEVGLLGDIRTVVAQEKRVKESRRLGYTIIISNLTQKYLQDAIKKYLH